MGIMSSLGLIPKLSKDFEKCETCSQAKITKKSHKSVVRNIELLELIHFDLCEFEGILTRGEIDILSLLLMISQNIQLFIC